MTTPIRFSRFSAFARARRLKQLSTERSPQRKPDRSWCGWRGWGRDSLTPKALFCSAPTSAGAGLIRESLWAAIPAWSTHTAETPWASLPALLLGLVVNAAAGHAGGWKDCSFNDSPIPCRDSHSPDGTVRIVWKDGRAMTYRLEKDGFPISTLRDSLGGIWEREILVQGNAVFTNPANGNRIVVPLR